MRYIIIVLACMLFFADCAWDKNDSEKKETGAEQTIPSDGRFNSSVINSPREGYIDSVFINEAGDRIYFLHSILAPNDILNGTNSYTQAELLPGHTTGLGLDWNTDLYYIEWDGSFWSEPKNLGSSIDGTSINSLANECCMWLNATETTIIFYRENLGLPALGENGNYIATRASRNDPWGEPQPLASVYGIAGQTADTYRHDIHKCSSGDMYLWEHDSSSGNKSKLLYGKWDGLALLDPVVIPGTDSADDETQPWVSADELVLLFNRRAADGSTSLMRMTRNDTSAEWGNLAEVTLTGFADPAGRIVWGEPTLPGTENYMLFIRFDTSLDPWKVDIMFSEGSAFDGFMEPVKLN